MPEQLTTSIVLQNHKLFRLGQNMKAPRPVNLEPPPSAHHPKPHRSCGLRVSY